MICFPLPKSFFYYRFRTPFEYLIIYVQLYGILLKVEYMQLFTLSIPISLSLIQIINQTPRQRNKKTPQ